MLWQDVVISITQVVMVLAVVPMLRKDAPRPSWDVALITSVALFTLAVTYATLLLLLSCFITFFMAIEWFVITTKAWHGGDRKLDTPSDPPY